MPNLVAALSIASIGAPFVQQHQRLVHVREEHAVDQEPGAVPDDDRRLAIRLARATMVTTVSSLVFSPRITSTSSMRSTG